MVLYFNLPFPAENVILQLMALRAPLVHEGLFYSYNLFLFKAPYIAYSIVLSGLYVFGLTVHKKIHAGKLARGDNPEEVIQRIADYRGDEKHPGYVRYTVEKAQAQLLQIKSSREERSRTPGGM